MKLLMEKNSSDRYQKPVLTLASKSLEVQTNELLMEKNSSDRYQKPVLTLASLSLKV